MRAGTGGGRGQISVWKRWVRIQSLTAAISDAFCTCISHWMRNILSLRNNWPLLQGDLSPLLLQEWQSVCISFSRASTATAAATAAAAAAAAAAATTAASATTAATTAASATTAAATAAAATAATATAAGAAAATTTATSTTSATSTASAATFLAHVGKCRHKQYKGRDQARASERERERERSIWQNNGQVKQLQSSKHCQWTSSNHVVWLWVMPRQIYILCIQRKSDAKSEFCRTHPAYIGPRIWCMDGFPWCLAYAHIQQEYIWMARNPSGSHQKNLQLGAECRFLWSFTLASSDNPLKDKHAPSLELLPASIMKLS